MHGENTELFQHRALGGLEYWLLQRQEGRQRGQANMWIPFLLRTRVRPILVLALCSTEHRGGERLGVSTVKAPLARHNHRDTATPKSWVSGGHTCTHSSFQEALPGRQRWQCAHPLPRLWAHSLPYISSQLNGAQGRFGVLLT